MPKGVAGVVGLILVAMEVEVRLPAWWLSARRWRSKKRRRTIRSSAAVLAVLVLALD